MTLVELCAGSAAVSLRYLDSRARPPLAWQGGKRGYADAILRAMGLAPGGGKGADIVLVEPGPWGEAWEHWRTEAGRADTIERLRAWADADPRWLWERLRAAPVPAEVGERVATWAVLVARRGGRAGSRLGGIPAAPARVAPRGARRARGLRPYVEQAAPRGAHPEPPGGGATRDRSGPC